MAYDPYAITVHVDGSAFDNPGGEGGIAGIVEFPDNLKREPETIFQQGYEETTNQRMELQACIEALEWTRANAQLLGVSRVIIVSDSMYLCEQYRRAQYWKKDNWRNREGRPVDNADLWERILFLIPKLGVRMEIQYEEGKSTPLGREVDKKAKQAAKGPGKIKDSGFRGGEISRTRLPGEAAAMFEACGQETVIRIYRKIPLFQFKRKDCKIIFESVSEETGKSTSKHFAYTSHEIEDGLHRSHLYRVRFNDNPQYPIIETVIEEV
jgi:ribonuclease HI